MPKGTNAARKNSTWRKVAIVVLVLLACKATAASVIARWAQPLIFNTDKWIQTVSPLPKDPTIAKAVATSTVNALFESADVNKIISDSLPEKARFLAAPLSNQIRTQATTTATNLVESDKFQEVWTGANRVAHEQFVRIATQPEGSGPLAKLGAKADTVKLDLASAEQQVRDRLGVSGQAVFNPGSGKELNQFRLDLKSKVTAIRDATKVVDRLHTVLPLVALSLFLAALAVSRSRRTTLVGIGLAVMVTSAALVITLKVLRPEVAGLASNSLNQQALGVAWDQVTSGLRSNSAWLMLPGAVIVLLAVAAGPYAWAVDVRKMIGLPKLKQTGAARGWRSFRGAVEERRQWFRGAGVALAIIILLLASSVTIAGVVGAIAAAVGYLSIVEMLRPTPR